MKIPVMNETKVVLLGRKKREYEVNGRKGQSFSLSILCDGDCGVIPCDETAYNIAGDLGEYVPVHLVADFDTNYRNLRVFHIEKDGK